jgi:hypothetical protein
MRSRITNGLRVGVLVAAMVAAATPAPAQAPPAPDAAPSRPAETPLPQSVTDSQGRFTMSFPEDWEVSTQARGMIALLAAGPAAAGTRPTVNVVTETLSAQMSPQRYAAAAEHLAKLTLHNYTVIQEATATVQGRAAYYRYMTWETNTGVSLYQMQVFLTEGLTGYVITGSTVNDRERILGDMPRITRIIETFRLAQAAANNYAPR